MSDFSLTWKVPGTWSFARGIFSWSDFHHFQPKIHWHIFSQCLGSWALASTHSLSTCSTLRGKPWPPPSTWWLCKIFMKSPNKTDDPTLWYEIVNYVFNGNITGMMISGMMMSGMMMFGMTWGWLHWVLIRFDTLYRLCSCTFVIHWRSYLMFFRTPLFSNSVDDFNLVKFRRKNIIWNHI